MLSKHFVIRRQYSGWLMKTQCRVVFPELILTNIVRCQNYLPIRHVFNYPSTIFCTRLQYCGDPHNTHLIIPYSIVTTHQCLPTYKQLFNYASTTSYSWWIFFSSSLSCALCHEHKQCQIFFCVNCKDWYRVTVLHILHREPFNSRNICWIKQFLNNTRNVKTKLSG